MSLSFKVGVRMPALAPQMVLALLVANEVYAAHGANCVVTSVCDGEHRRGSLHYQGCAIDLRTYGLSSKPSSAYGALGEMRDQEKKEMAQTIQDRLGGDFDVIFEPDVFQVGPTGAKVQVRHQHIHIEYQPKLPY